MSGYKIFVSYKYKDSNVYHSLEDNSDYIYLCTVRDYVNYFESKIANSDHIYKGEHDNEDLSKLSDETIWQKLKDRIYDSTLTILFISSGMKEHSKPENDQWIPWEISYSLKESKRNDRTTHSNAIIAVVLPDRFDSYDYFENDYLFQGTIYGYGEERKDILFEIIRKNMLNCINPPPINIPHIFDIWNNNLSYIVTAKWSDFIGDYNKYINRAYKNLESIDQFNIVKTLNE